MRRATRACENLASCWRRSQRMQLSRKWNQLELSIVIAASSHAVRSPVKKRRRFQHGRRKVSIYPSSTSRAGRGRRLFLKDKKIRKSQSPESKLSAASSALQVRLGSRREIDEKNKDQNVPCRPHRRFFWRCGDAGCAVRADVLSLKRRSHGVPPQWYGFGASEATQRVLGRQRRAPTTPTTRSAPRRAPPSLRGPPRSPPANGRRALLSHQTLHSTHSTKK